MASETEICNMALLRFGESRIMDLDEDSKAARTCKLYYGPTRNELLRGHPWNFAIERTTLTALSTAPAFGFSYQYQLPVDCLRLISLNELYAWEPGGLYEIEGRLLLTNESTAKIKYIRKEEDPNEFDSLFVEALVLKLASKLVGNLTGDVQASGLFLQEFNQMALPNARRIDGTEPRRPNVIRHDSKLVRSRFGEPAEYSGSSSGSSTTTTSSSSTAPAAHASTHQHGGTDEVATVTPGANAIPKAADTGMLAAGWLPVMVGDSGSGGTKGAVPAPAAGDAAAAKFLKADGTWATTAGGGDMTTATYDPTAVAGDAFAMDNMAEGATTKILTDTERTKLTGIEASADVTDATNVAAAIDGATAKTTPVDADTVPLIDSAASSALKKLSWANIKATLKTYFDTLYSGATHASNHTDGTDDIQSATNAQKGLATAAHITAIEANTAKVSNATHTGDVTGDTALTIAANAVTNAKAAQMTQGTIKGRQAAGGTGDPEDLTPAQARTVLNVEDGADVTDATNVDAAGAVMNGDTSTAAMSFVVDEDNMASDSATKVPTQQSVKAYVDAQAGGSGAILQKVITKSVTEASTTLGFPADNTIPQNTEGAAYASLDTAFTPVAADSTIVVEVTLQISASATASPAAGLFKDSGADALATGWLTIDGAGRRGSIAFVYSELSGSTTARTYKVRFSSDAGTAYINGSTASLYGATLTSSMVITEIAAP